MSEAGTVDPRWARAAEAITDGPEAGWQRWLLVGDGRFLDAVGQARFRAVGPNRAQVRVDTGRAQQNLGEALHGGFLSAFADHAMFVGLRALNKFTLGDAVTLDLSMQYLDAGRPGEPVDAYVELLRETGRLIWVRGTVHQGADERLVAAFNGTLRKVRRAER